jgi:hypothetical protein
MHTIRKTTTKVYIIQSSIFLHQPITVAARSKAETGFSLLNTGIVGSNPTQNMNVSVLLFCVYVVAFRRADLPFKESYLLCIALRN